MNAENKILDAYRAGRIGKFRAWWETRYCRHNTSCSIQKVHNETDGIDTWSFPVFYCTRCGAWFKLSNLGHYRETIIPAPKLTKDND